MMSRRKFLAASGAAATALPFVARATDKPALQIGLVADPQYADAPPLATRYYRQSIDKLAKAINHFNAQELDFCVNVGDAIDRSWNSFDTILKVFGKSRHKFHHLLGNHDFDLPDENKAAVPGRLGLERRYYSVTQNGFCLAMLDTNDVSVYAQPRDAKETALAVAALNHFAQTGIIHAQTWNGAVGTQQMKWLEETCRKAAETKEKVIVFAHHPVFPFPCNHNAWNSDALLQMVDRNRNIVAWINGHNHAGAYALRNGVPFITLKGMVETEDTNAYAVARLHADRLEIAGEGREPSREIPFRSVA